MLFEFQPQLMLITDQDDVDASPGGEHRTGDGFDRGVIATHRIERYAGQSRILLVGWNRDRATAIGTASRASAVRHFWFMTLRAGRRSRMLHLPLRLTSASARTRHFFLGDRHGELLTDLRGLKAEPI